MPSRGGGIEDDWNLARFKFNRESLHAWFFCVMDTENGVIIGFFEPDLWHEVIL